LARMSRPDRSMVDRLVDGVRAGSVVTVSDGVPDGLVGTDDARSAIDVDAVVVRDLLRARTVGDPDPRSMWIRGARIRGRLDLDQVAAVCPRILEECLLESGMSLAGAQLPALSLLGCRIEGGNVPAVAGRGVRVAGALTLRGSRVEAAAVAGAVVLIGARIGGDLDCRGAVLGNSVGAAMEADRAQIGRRGLGPAVEHPRPHRRPHARAGRRAGQRPAGGEWPNTRLHDVLTAAIPARDPSTPAEAARL
jgi:hypothetical protein